MTQWNMSKKLLGQRISSAFSGAVRKYHSKVPTANEPPLQAAISAAIARLLSFDVTSADLSDLLYSSAAS